jgi:hypothetical protein
MHFNLPEAFTAVWVGVSGKYVLYGYSHQKAISAVGLALNVLE